MSYSTDSGGAFRPFRQGDFGTRRPIQVGGQTTTPYAKGIQDLAYNQLTLWAQTAPVVVSDTKEADVVCTTAAVDYIFALYYHFLPGLLNEDATTGRRYLQVEVTAKCASGRKWYPEAQTSDGTVADGYESNDLGNLETIVMEVELPYSGLDYLLLTMAASADATSVEVYGVTARVLQVSGNLGDLGDVAGQYFSPVDSTVEPTADRPLHVQFVRSLIGANQNLYNRNGRSIVSFCQWGNWGTSIGAGVTSSLNIFTFSATNINQALEHEWVYFPRPGVRRLRAFCDAYMVGWTTEVGRLLLGFGDMGNALEIPVEIDVGLKDATLGYVPVPEGPGPHFLRLIRTDTETPDIKVMSLTIQEEIE